MTDELKAICITDEALDVDALPAGTLHRYIESRDFALVGDHMIPGSKATLFFIREIPQRLFLKYVVTQANETDRAVAAFQCGVVRVENMRSADGAIMDAAGLAHHENGALRDEELERFDASEILEIGEVAYVRSFFRRRTERVYRLPPSLAERWVAQVAHRAAQNQALLESSKAAA